MVETTAVAPPSPRLSGEHTRDRASATFPDATSCNSSIKSGTRQQLCDGEDDAGYGEIRVLLRQARLSQNAHQPIGADKRTNVDPGDNCMLYADVNVLIFWLLRSSLLANR